MIATDTQVLNIDPTKMRLAVEAEIEREKNEHASNTVEVSKFTSKEILGALNSNEDGDAWIYIESHRGHFLYDHAAKTWHKWTGNYWEEDLIDEVIASIQAVIEVYGEEAQRQIWVLKKTKNQAEAERATATIDALTKRINGLRTLRRKENILHLAKVGRESLAIIGSEWDRDPWLLGCQNGVIDLRTGQHRPGKPEDYIKTVAPTEWLGLDAPALRWGQFLIEIFDGDNGLIAYMQKLLGYGVTGFNTEHVYPILWGIGRNGKSTLLEILKHALGKLAYKAEAEILLEQKNTRQSGAPNSSIIALRGKRIVWASETNEGRRLDVSKVKEISGGDTLNARPLYAKRHIEFETTHLLFLLTNYKPHVPARDFALWHRIFLIPFTQSFLDDPAQDNERKAEKDLLGKLKMESSGILAWLVRGCLAWQQEGLNPPESIKAATKAYQEDEDLTGHFLDDFCIIAPNTEVKAGQLYEAYKKWCNDMGHRAMSGTRFGKEIKGRFNSYKTRQGVFYMGLGLTAQEHEV
jgi:putative DNA primase/helicase